MVCRSKGRAEAAKGEIVEQSKNQVRNLLHVCLSQRRDRYSVALPEGEISGVGIFFLTWIKGQMIEGVMLF